MRPKIGKNIITKPRAKVALIHTSSYESKIVLASLERGLELLGGMKHFFAKNEKCLLKPNLLAAVSPAKAATTHPAVFEAVILLCQKASLKLSYGDSPGFHSPQKASLVCGLQEIAQKYQIPLADFVNGQDITLKEALINKKFTIANGYFASDGNMINLPKFKTHGFAKLTACLKNTFGLVPGFLKGEFHVKIPGAEDFSKMLVDLHSYLKPRLHIMDGIIAMEGNGPYSGTPRQVNLLALSSDPVALDATLCRIIGIDPELVPTIYWGEKAGLGVYQSDQIELVGDPMEAFQVFDFDINRDKIKSYRQKGWVRFLQNHFVSKPAIDQKKCVKCGVCINVCPVKPKALDWAQTNNKGFPFYHYQSCIRCCCCHEFCPHGAIYLRVPLFRKIFGKKRKNT